MGTDTKRTFADFVGQDEAQLRHGGCTCGAVRFVLKGDPAVIGLCHCTSCRKESGGAFLWYADWPRAALTFSGEIKTFAGRSFCPACGSRLFHLTDDKAEILLGALDEAPSGLRPTVEGWIRRREPWLAPVIDACQFDNDTS